MILDPRGNSLRRAIGFVGGFTREPEAREPLVSAIGFQLAPEGLHEESDQQTEGANA